MQTLFQRPDRIHSPLYVILMVSNPIRFRVRWKLTEDILHQLVTCLGGEEHTRIVEVAYGERDFALTDPNNPHHLQIRTDSEIWHKENAQNLLVQRLPLDWRYVAFVDADVTFARPDILNETLHQLQHYPIVQMWSEAQDLDSHHQMVQTHRGFAYSWTHGLPFTKDCGYYGDSGTKAIHYHPGYAWAFRREAFDALGGLLDHCILGSADAHMAWSLIGKADLTIKHELSDRYKYLVLQWQERAEKFIKRNIGYVPGLLLHYWHGPKKSRRYMDRWKILTETGFDPDLDLKKDWQGLWQLTDRSPDLRNKMKAYFRQREEDMPSTDSAWSESMLLDRKP